MMPNTKTTMTKNDHYFRALATLVALAVLASLLAVFGVRPAHADGEFIFKVNSTSDLSDRSPGDLHCDVDLAVGDSCTLRAAIQEANATPETDIIAFDIPEGFRDPTSGVATISPATGLPPITQPVLINGYSQPGSSANTLAVGDNAVIKVELNGSKVITTTLVDGLKFVNSSGSMIRGLAINDFLGSGISVSGDASSGPTIANDNLIVGNFIGTDPSGKQDQGNLTDGVAVGSGAFGTTVGGSSPSERNVISGNGASGVSILSDSAGTRVQGNYIGTDKSGNTDLGNQGHGILSSASNNAIGGTTAGAGNVISGNNNSGVVVAETKNNAVLGNRIGTTASGAGDLGNSFAGVVLQSATGTSVGDGTCAGANTIAFNGGVFSSIDGVEVLGSGSAGNSILSNSIFSNAGLGIDLVGGFEDSSQATANDPGDIDSGPNNLQNKPVISSAKTTSTATNISARLNSQVNTTYIVQFFSNPAGTNEGKTFIGQKTVATEASGKASFTFKPSRKVAAGKNITATATRRNFFSKPSDTSEFSAPRKVVAS
jgi:CSLREA domain-containing protein